MKQRLMMLAVLLCCAVMMMAESVSPAAARAAAAKFLLGQGTAITDEEVATPRGGRAAADDPSPAYYVFNADAAKGFVVVSGDDCVGDNLVLGYAAEGSFSENDIPDGLQWWLDATAESIARLSTLGIKVAATPLHDDIAPLLTSTWDQGSPYNAYCPNFSGQQSVTGCMATALAQVMRYHRWPQAPIASELPAYTMINGTEIGALPVTQFDWDNMLDNYNGTTNEAQQHAVAELMRYCGQLIQMDYSPQGSNGVCYDLDLLVNSFGYDPGLYAANADDYTVNGWDALVYNELHEGRPLVYSGRSTGGGHAFVLDGYEAQSGEGYYHVNWGWSGGGNGFYKINLLDPDLSGIGGSTTRDGYCRDQGALIGFQPRQNPSEVFYRRLSSMEWDKTDGATWHRFIMLNQSYQSGKFSAGIVERKEDGTPDLTKFLFAENVEVSGFTTASLMTDGTKGLVGFTITNDNAPNLFSGLTPGRHRFMFVSRQNVAGAPWEPVFGPNNYIEVNIGASGQLTNMTVHPQPSLSAPGEGIKVEGPLQRGLLESVTATVNNSGSDDYIGGVECAVYYVKDGILQTYTSISITGIMIEAGGSSDIYYDISVPQAGDYVVLLTKYGLGGNESGLALANIQQAKGYIGHKSFSCGELPFYCLDAQYVVRYDAQENPGYFIDVAVKNETPLDYDAALMVKIYKPDGTGGYVPVELPGVPYIYTRMTIPSGQSQVGYILLPEALEAGEYGLDLYIAKDFSSSKPDDYFCFASGPLTVSDTGIEEVQGSGFKVQEGEWYDLNGRKLSGQPDKKGIYIHEGKKYLIP